MSVLITNKEVSYTGFRLVQTSVTLNDLEGRNSPYFALFHRIHSFSNRQHLSYDVCLEVRGEIIKTVLCCIVY